MDRDPPKKRSLGHSISQPRFSFSPPLVSFTSRHFSTRAASISLSRAATTAGSAPRNAESCHPAPLISLPPTPNPPPSPRVTSTNNDARSARNGRSTAPSPRKIAPSTPGVARRQRSCNRKCKYVYDVQYVSPSGFLGFLRHRERSPNPVNVSIMQGAAESESGKSAGDARTRAHAHRCKRHPPPLWRRARLDYYRLLRPRRSGVSQLFIRRPLLFPSALLGKRQGAYADARSFRHCLPRAVSRGDQESSCGSLLSPLLCHYPALPVPLSSRCSLAIANAERFFSLPVKLPETTTRHDNIRNNRIISDNVRLFRILSRLDPMRIRSLVN